MTNVLKRLLLSATAAMCAGCATQINTAEHALTVAEEHPISVDSQTVTMTMAPAKSAGDLSSLDRARLRAFADSYMRDGHGVLTVTAASDSDGSAAGVRAALHEFGVPETSMAVAAYRGGASSQDVILSYSHYVATPSACGIWDGIRERDYRNMRTPNFGCATQNNLAAMIGDPRDLVEPAAMTDPDSATRIRGVTLFRKGEVTSSATDGAVESQIAK